MSDADNYAGSYNNRNPINRHGYHALFAVFAVPEREIGAEVCTLLRESTACGGYWAFGGILFAIYRFNRVAARYARGCCYNCRHIASYLEKEYVDFHRCGDRYLYVACAIRVLKIFLDKNTKNA